MRLSDGGVPNGIGITEVIETRQGEMRVRAVDWCECQHPDHFDSGKDEHTYGEHVRATVIRRDGARCRHCDEVH